MAVMGSCIALLGRLAEACGLRKRHSAEETEARLLVGARRLGVRVGDGVRFASGLPSFGSEPFLIEIGRNCTFSGDVLFLTHDGGIGAARHLVRPEGPISKLGRIRIGEGCFIGARVTILPDVTVGDHCVIGACSVVTKDIPSGEVWAGNPARRIATLEEYARKVKDIAFSPEQLALRDEVISKRGW